MLEREFNNLLALGTDRRLDDVSTKSLLCPDHAEHLFLCKTQERQDLCSLPPCPVVSNSASQAL